LQRTGQVTFLPRKPIRLVGVAYNSTFSTETLYHDMRKVKFVENIKIGS